MNLIQCPKIVTTQVERNTLREAAEMVKEIVDLLEKNKAEGFTPFQEGLTAPEAFWDLKKSFERIEEGELIP